MKVFWQKKENGKEMHSTILKEAKYKKANLAQIVAMQEYLTKEQPKGLLWLVVQHEAGALDRSA